MFGIRLKRCQRCDEFIFWTNYLQLSKPLCYKYQNYHFPTMLIWQFSFLVQGEFSRSFASGFVRISATISSERTYFSSIAQREQIGSVCIVCIYVIAHVASVSVKFRGQKRTRKWIFGFDRARNETRVKKWKTREGEGKEKRKETLADKPFDFENLRSPANAAPDWLS